MKPLIGVIPLVDIERESLWMVPGYMYGIIEAGGIPVMLPLTEDDEIIDELAKSISGLLMTGGQDVSPALYNEPCHELCGQVCEKRDRMEGKIFSKMLEADKPILGICRGIQFINAYFGGSLYQDLNSEAPSGTDHHMDPPYERYVHSVTVAEGTKLFEIIGKGAAVNSYHHQGVKTLAPGLIASAYALDGLIEAVEKPDSYFLLAVQWHPEWLYSMDENSMNLFRAFVRASSEI